MLLYNGTSLTLTQYNSPYTIQEYRCLTYPSPFKTPCPQGKETWNANNPKTPKWHLQWHPSHCTKTSVTSRVLKVLVLFCNTAISSVATCPSSSTGGRVGKGVTCWPSFNFKQDEFWTQEVNPTCKTQTQPSVSPWKDQNTLKTTSTSLYKLKFSVYRVIASSKPNHPPQRIYPTYAYQLETSSSLEQHEDGP